MERLIENELMFGGLMPVSREHMVARYNSALAQFGSRQTALEAFSIDATGFSPEIAEEFGDPHYLDPHGVNRRFIILTPEQGKLPVVQLNFSSTGDLVREFFARNMDAIKFLTLKDVVYGEIEDQTYRIDDLDDILSIKALEFQVKTVGGLLRKAEELSRLVERFREDADSWRDDALLERIAALASECGDTRRIDPVPRHVQFDQTSFWTRHFGGLYVFHDAQDPPVVVGWPHEPAFARAQLARYRYISMEEADEVYDYLMESGRLEPVNYEWLQSSRILEHREDLYVRTAIARAEPKLEVAALTSAWLNNWITDNYDELAEGGTFPVLLRLRKLVHNRQTIPSDLLAAVHKFMLVRAAPDHAEQRLVNRLISEFVPFDFLMRFIYNKEAFYRDYETYGEALREYVVHTITTRYFPDKSSLRQRLFQ